MGKDRKVVLTAECICDMPEHLLKEIDVNIIHYNICIGEYEYQTETEINTENILEYMERSDEKVETYAPKVEEYRSFFKANIKEGKPLLHLALDAQAGDSYVNAMEAAKDFPQVTVLDSRQISGGLGLLVLAAAEAADEGKNIAEIICQLDLLQKRVNTSFLISRGEYMYQKWNIQKGIVKILNRFPTHLEVRLKGGEIKTSYFKIKFGILQECYRGYIRGILKRARPDGGVLILTHAGCSYEQQEEIRREIEKYVHFNKIIVNTASAVVTCNCGGKSIGLQFLNET